MKPTNDLFEQQVRSIYEGFEVPAPASTKDAVFKELDSANALTLGSFASKSLIIAASLLTIGAIYMLNTDSHVVEQAPVVIEQVVEETINTQPAFETPLTIEEVAEETQVVIDEVVETAEEVVVESTVVVETIVEKTVVETPEVVEASVLEEIKEVALPVETVTETPVEEKKEKEKKEEVEWVLPAKIKIEK